MTSLPVVETECRACSVVLMLKAAYNAYCVGRISVSKDRHNVHATRNTQYEILARLA